MLNKICFSVVIMGFIAVIVEGLVLEKNLSTLIAIAVTGIIFTLAIIIFEAANRVRRQLKS
jgi:mannose/fructose/N-acetylgalactosamine-specific phosphotransferase system component IIC